MKIALLSNVNIQAIARRLSKEVEVYISTGHGLVMEELISSSSDLWNRDNKTIFIYIDVWEFTEYGERLESIGKWFHDFKGCIHSDCTYFIFNADWRGGYITGYKGEFEAHRIETLWNNEMNTLCNEMKNCYTLDFKSIIENHGRNAIYSDKIWLLGKIPFSSFGEKLVAEEILLMVQLLTSSAKKVLILDLDQTLWGGVAGEEGIAGIQLAKEGYGSAYYYFQSAIKKIKTSGTILCIASKNNMEDVKEIFDKHPDMALRMSDFTVIKANWNSKSQNIYEISTELQLSPDSFVFIDDNPVEREEVFQNFPEMVIPEFPSDISELRFFSDKLYKKYFSKLSLTEEDLVKVNTYAENLKRQETRKNFIELDDFLRSLQIKVELVANYKDYITRIHQLIMKTNQFNLTAKRIDLSELNRMLSDKNEVFYLFSVSDCFGNSGQTGLVIVNIGELSPVIELFVMSCRIMGRRIENYILSFVEKDLLSRGFTSVSAKYVYAAKSKPVVNYYDEMGYECVQENGLEKWYSYDLASNRKRDFQVVG